MKLLWAIVLVLAGLWWLAKKGLFLGCLAVAAVLVGLARLLLPGKSCQEIVLRRGGP